MGMIPLFHKAFGEFNFLGVGGAPIDERRSDTNFSI